MAAQFMVLLTEEGNATRGEMKHLESAEDVANYIEVLLEGGFTRENIRVFHGEEIEVEVTYRPVVSLSPAGGQPPEAYRVGAPDSEDTEDEAVPVTRGDDGQGVINGVRLSEQFRPS